jgi:hypothetical protein
MNRIKVEVVFEVEYFVDDGFTDEELIAISTEMVGSEFPRGWCSDGIEEYGADTKSARIIEKEVLDDSCESKD